MCGIKSRWRCSLSVSNQVHVLMVVSCLHVCGLCMFSFRLALTRQDVELEVMR